MTEGELSAAAVETHTSTERLVEGDVVVELISDNEVELEAAPIEAETTPLEATAPVYADFQPAPDLDMVTYAEITPLGLETIPDQKMIIHGAPSEIPQAQTPAASQASLRHAAKHANRFELLAGETAA